MLAKGKDAAVTPAAAKAAHDALAEQLSKGIEDIEDRLQGLRARAAAQAKKEAGAKALSAFQAYKAWSGEQLSAVDDVEV